MSRHLKDSSKTAADEKHTEQNRGCAVGKSGRFPVSCGCAAADGSETNARMRLIEAAKKEFLEHGYEKASLRKICSGAGVTTGALYFFFRNKEDLFDNVVHETVILLEQLSGTMVAEELEHPEIGVDNEKRLLEFCWKHQDVIRILFDKSQGTSYENYMRDMAAYMEKIFERFFAEFGAAEADRELIHILVKMKFQGYMELMMGGYTLERTLELAQKIGWYTEGGFRCLIEQLNHRM